MSTSRTAPLPNVPHFIARHHQVVTGESKQTYDVYSTYLIPTTIKPILGPSTPHEFSAAVPVGPIIVGVEGLFEPSSLESRVEAYVQAPIFGKLTAVELTGNLKDGLKGNITSSHGGPSAISGEVRLSAEKNVNENNNLYITLEFALKAFDKQYPKSGSEERLPLFPLPKHQ